MSLYEEKDDTPLLGILLNATNHITFTASGVGDILYPVFITFDKEGN